MKTKNRKFPWLDEASMVSWWLTWNDLKWPAGEVVNQWKHRADRYQSLGVNAVTTFGVHFRWDWLNYFDRYDGMLRQLVEICHARGIAVTDHHSNQLVHRIRSAQDRDEIVRNQDHHLPLYPDSWENQELNGKNLSDWRIISAKDHQPVYLPGYHAEAFCPNHPGYRKEYYAYANRLVKNTGIDGLMSDDTAFHPDIYSCVCLYCHEKFKHRTGSDIPPIEAKEFWNNSRNPLFQEWIQMRYDSVNQFYRGLRQTLPASVALWGCSCGDIMPYKVRQGCSMENWIHSMDTVFVELYHGLDREKHKARVLSELAVASSLGDYHGKPALTLCYSDQLEEFEKWAELFERFGVRPWYCRQVRKAPVIFEETILQEGLPKIRLEAVQPYGCGIVYSRKLKDRLGANDDSYYHAFSSQVEKVFTGGLRPQIIFDDFKPDTVFYGNVYVPMANQLDEEMKDYLTTLGDKLKEG